MTNKNWARLKNSTWLNNWQVLDEKIKQSQDEAESDIWTQLRVRNLIKYFTKCNNK